MYQWKMHKYDNEAYKRTYQIYFVDHQGLKWYLGDSLFYGEAASLIDLLSDPDVRAAVTEYMDAVPSGPMDFSAYSKAFAAVRPALDRICSAHDINWLRAAINLDTIKDALLIERKADNA